MHFLIVYLDTHNINIIGPDKILAMCILLLSKTCFHTNWVNIMYNRGFDKKAVGGFSYRLTEIGFTLNISIKDGTIHFFIVFFLLQHEIELCFKTILRKRKVTYSLVRKYFFWSPTFLIYRPSCADKLGKGAVQGLSQDLETGCPKLAIVKFWGVLFFDKGDLRD